MHYSEDWSYISLVVWEIRQVSAGIPTWKMCFATCRVWKKNLSIEGAWNPRSCCPPLITLWNSCCGGGRVGAPWSMPVGGGSVFTPQSHGWRPSLLSCPASAHCLVLVQLHATWTQKVGNENWFPRAYTLYRWLKLPPLRIRPADGKLLSLILTFQNLFFPLTPTFLI